MLNERKKQTWKRNIVHSQYITTIDTNDILFVILLLMIVVVLPLYLHLDLYHLSIFFSSFYFDYTHNHSTPGRSIRLSDRIGSYVGLYRNRRSDVIPIGFRVTELYRNPSEADPIGS